MTPTEGGQSGCPVYSSSGVVAIHVGSGKKSGENFNVGRLITADIIDNL